MPAPGRAVAERARFGLAQRTGPRRARAGDGAGQAAATARPRPYRRQIIPPARSRPSKLPRPRPVAIELEPKADRSRHPAPRAEDRCPRGRAEYGHRPPRPRHVARLAFLGKGFLERPRFRRPPIADLLADDDDAGEEIELISISSGDEEVPELTPLDPAALAQERPPAPDRRRVRRRLRCHRAGRAQAAAAQAGAQGSALRRSPAAGVPPSWSTA